MAEVIPNGSGVITGVMHDLYDLDGNVIGHKVELSATAAQGYRFDYFEWTQHVFWENDFRPQTTQTLGSVANPEPNGPRKVDQLTRYGVYYHEEYYNVKAYFIWIGPGPGPEPGTKFTVTISASPQAGGVVNGGGEYNSGATCTLSASRNVGYELMRLENAADGITIYPPNPPQCFGKTITHSFAVTKSSSWVAYFRECTNAILRGNSGNILHGQGGNILRDW